MQIRRGMALFLVSIICAAAVLFAFKSSMWQRLQNSLIFYPTRELYRTPAAMGWDYEDVWLAVGTERTHGWWIPQENPRGTVLFSHGNAGNIADRIESVALLRSFGLSVFAYDYGGYGLSSGKCSEQRCFEDAYAAWQYLTEERGIAPERIIIFGRSLGGAVTIDLAARVKPAGIVVESTFTNIEDMAKHLFPRLPLHAWVSVRFASIEKISAVRAPLLLFHSREDEVVPFVLGQALFTAAPHPKRFVEIHGPHNNGFALSGDLYTSAWHSFLDEVLPR